MNRIFISFCILFFGNFAAAEVENDYAQSTIGMVPLLNMEQDLTNNMDSYVNQLNEKLNQIKLIGNNLRKVHAKSENNPEEFLSNPLNSFALVRRMHSDWHKWQTYMQQKVGKSQIDFIEQLHAKLPTSKDLKDAFDAISRLQDTYQLTTNDFVSGILNGKQTNAKLSSLDCYEIGLQFFEMKEFSKSKLWLDVALQLHTPSMKKFDEILGTGLAEILFLISNYFLEMGNFEELFKFINLALKQRPNDEKFMGFKNSLELFMAHENNCRLDSSIMLKRHKLQCFYNRTTHPFLKLAPLKMEIIAEDPYLVLYHDVIYNNEIEVLKNLAKSDLQRGMAGSGVIHSERTVQQKSIAFNESALTLRIERRIADMTGFDGNVEPYMQIVNYGLGGHYYNHIDYYDLNKTPNDSISLYGERIGAVLFYLNDVELGGATVFPKINKFVQPKKGTAIFWHHLDNAGNGNDKSLHASCPVLFGSKWVLARMLHAQAQMFIKPCLKEP